ncbi:hypothetical protein RJD40_14245 [Vibrio scophthalmi]|uniref:hypothetical protein n=1 Tax=Vibrio scophthalmi TaxID=45658 RepID=UPI003AAE0B47
MNVDDFNFSEKFLLISLLSKHGCEFNFSERIDRFSERYNVSSNNVTSLFSKLTKSGFLEKERRYPEKDKAKYRYCFKASLAGWFYDQSVLGVRNNVSDLKFFLREMENRYPNADRTILADQRWFLLILIAHQDEFGTVTHLTIKDLCYLMGDIGEGRLKRIQKKAVEAKLISVLKTSATFFNEVKNVYVLKGTKGRKLYLPSAAEIEMPYIPSSIDLWRKVLPHKAQDKKKHIAYFPEELKVTWVMYSFERPEYIYKLLQARLPVFDAGLKYMYAKYFNKDSQDALYLMQIKLNEMASLMLSNYWNDLKFTSIKEIQPLINKLLNDKAFINQLDWRRLLSKGMLKTIENVPEKDLMRLLNSGITLERRIGEFSNINDEQRSVLGFYVRLIQGMLAYSVGIAHQYYNLLKEHGKIESDAYNHIIEPHDFQNLPMIKDKLVTLHSVHSYIPNTQGNEFHHLIEFRRNDKEKKKITYKRTMIESTLIT